MVSASCFHCCQLLACLVVSLLQMASTSFAMSHSRLRRRVFSAACDGGVKHMGKENDMATS